MSFKSYNFFSKSVIMNYVIDENGELSQIFIKNSDLLNLKLHKNSNKSKFQRNFNKNLILRRKFRLMKHIVLRRKFRLMKHIVLTRKFVLTKPFVLRRKFRLMNKFDKFCTANVSKKYSLFSGFFPFIIIKALFLGIAFFSPLFRKIEPIYFHTYNPAFATITRGNSSIERQIQNRQKKIKLMHGNDEIKTFYSTSLETDDILNEIQPKSPEELNPNVLSSGEEEENPRIPVSPSSSEEEKEKDEIPTLYPASIEIEDVLKTLESFSLEATKTTVSPAAVETLSLLPSFKSMSLGVNTTTIDLSSLKNYKLPLLPDCNLLDNNSHAIQKLKRIRSFCKTASFAIKATEEKMMAPETMEKIDSELDSLGEEYQEAKKDMILKISEEETKITQAQPKYTKKFKKDAENFIESVDTILERRDDLLCYKKRIIKIKIKKLKEKFNQKVGSSEESITIPIPLFKRLEELKYTFKVSRSFYRIKGCETNFSKKEINKTRLSLEGPQKKAYNFDKKKDTITLPLNHFLKYEFYKATKKDTELSMALIDAVIKK